MVEGIKTGSGGRFCYQIARGQVRSRNPNPKSNGIEVGHI